LGRVADEGEADQAAVAVLLRPEPFEPQRMSGGQSLQGAIVVASFDAGEPHLAAVAEQKRAAVARRRDGRHADGRELAGFLRHRIAHKERACGGE
jgi:hypothetical protein